MGGEDKLKPVKDPILAAVRWVKSRGSKEKTGLGVAAGVVVRAQLSFCRDQRAVRPALNPFTPAGETVSQSLLAASVF